MTRSTEYGKLMIAAGRCYHCGKPRGKSPRYCDEHAEKNRLRVREYHRMKRGTKPWRKGGPGRPPK